MPAPYNQLYVHCVWATWDRLPLITQQIEQQVYASILAKCEALGCTAVAIDGIDDHVHLLVRFPPALPLVKLIGEVKGASSHLVTHKLEPQSFFKWQASYGVFTVSMRSLDNVAAYVRNQKQRHAHNMLLPALEHCADPTTNI
jgi:REP element-mobilizing transposase RayT